MTPLRVALGGLATLAVAMGIGRFAFTPILPMMLRDGTLDLARGSWLASANYLGYLAGAVVCTVEPSLRRALSTAGATIVPALAERRAARSVRIGLAATVLLTAAMALPVAGAWAGLRFAAGVASAYVLVQASGWCAARLAERGTPDLGGVMFAGPGAGIVATGLLASGMVAAGWRAEWAWAAFAGFAVVLVAVAWPVFGERASFRATRASAAEAPDDGVPLAAVDPGASAGVALRHSTAEVATLAVAYGIAGFGYIVTATFLPVIAREAMAGSALLDLFWPMFGGGVVVGALAASQWKTMVDRRRLLALSYAVQAIGIGLGLVRPDALGFTLGSLLLGLPFTAITFYALQEVRRIRADAVPATMGLVTALFALGQAAGPPLVSALLAASADAHTAFQRALAIAAGSLGVGAAMYLASDRAWPNRASSVQPSR